MTWSEVYPIATAPCPGAPGIYRVFLATADVAPAALWRHVEGRLEIRLLHRGQTHAAVVSEDGTIHYQGKAFSTPSGAARAITGVPTNGWRVWQYQRSPGEWVPLRALRPTTDGPSLGGG